MVPERGLTNSLYQISVPRSLKTLNTTAFRKFERGIISVLITN